MSTTSIRWHAPLLCALSCAAGCSDRYIEPDWCGVSNHMDHEPCSVIQETPINPASDTYVFVVDSVTLPGSAATAQSLGFDLDGDPKCRPDNALGQLLSMTFGFFDADGTAIGSEFIQQGRILQLVEVQAESVDHADGVAIRIHVGIDEDGTADDNFSGVEAFAIDTQASGEPMSGLIRERRLRADVGVVPLQIAIPRIEAPHLTTLTAARIDARFTDEGLEGRLAGAMSNEAVDALAEQAVIAINDVIAEDCPLGECVPDSKGEGLLYLFDENLDGRLTVSELRSNALMGSLLSPDVDLYDEAGQLNPRCDEVLDSLSVGLAFTAVPARFASPPPMPRP